MPKFKTETKAGFFLVVPREPFVDRIANNKRMKNKYEYETNQSCIADCSSQFSHSMHVNPSFKRSNKKQDSFA